MSASPSEAAHARGAGVEPSSVSPHPSHLRGGVRGGHDPIKLIFKEGIHLPSTGWKPRVPLSPLMSRPFHLRPRPRGTEQDPTTPRGRGRASRLEVLSRFCVSKGLAPPQHLVPSSGVIQRPFLRLVSGVSATSALARPPRLSAHEEPPPRTSAPRPGEPRNARARRLLSTSQWPPTCKPVSKPTGLQAKTSGEVYGKVLGLSTDESRTQASDGASSPTAKRRSCSQSGIGSR